MKLMNLIKEVNGLTKEIQNNVKSIKRTLDNPKNIGKNLSNIPNLATKLKNNCIDRQETIELLRGSLMGIKYEIDKNE